MVRAAPLLTALTLSAHLHAAEALTVEVTARDACPGETWFRDRLERRGVRGHVRAFLRAEAEGYAGEIDARSDAGGSVQRRLTGALCTTVAEGLLVVAEVHLAGLVPPPPPILAPPPPPPPPPPAPRPPPPAPLVRLALGAHATVDTAVAGDPAVGGGLTAWLALGTRPFRGLALSGTYSRGDLTRTVPLTHEHLRARLDLLPLDVALDGQTALGFSLFLSAGNLHVSARIDNSTPGSRALWLTGIGARARRHIGPLFLELGVDGTLAITRRRFELDGAATPLFSLPLLGFAATLSAGIPIAP